MYDYNTSELIVEKVSPPKWMDIILQQIHEVIQLNDEDYIQRSITLMHHLDDEGDPIQINGYFIIPLLEKWLQNISPSIKLQISAEVSPFINELCLIEKSILNITIADVLLFIQRIMCYPVQLLMDGNQQIRLQIGKLVSDNISTMGFDTVESKIVYHDVTSNLSVQSNNKIQTNYQNLSNQKGNKVLIFTPYLYHYSVMDAALRDYNNQGLDCIIVQANPETFETIHPEFDNRYNVSLTNLTANQLIKNHPFQGILKIYPDNYVYDTDSAKKIQIGKIIIPLYINSIGMMQRILQTPQIQILNSQNKEIEPLNLAIDFDKNIILLNYYIKFNE
jgi:hypothetical protein